MGKFCKSCGMALKEGAEFCAKCGANAASAPEWSGALPDKALPNLGTVLSKAGEKVKNEAKTKSVEYAKSLIPGAILAYQMAGEFSLPSELIPTTGNLAEEGLLSILKGGFSGLVDGFKRTLSDKKRLIIVITLAVIWLLVNLLAALGVFPLPVRVLSWLTAARGSLIGGSIGKGLVAALLAQVVVDKGTLQSLKGGISQLKDIVKDGKKAFAPLLLGAGVGLIACNLMGSSYPENTMVCIAGFLLSVKALTNNGFLRRLVNALMPKAQSTKITNLMLGWTLGFALFAIISFLPGGGNGYVFGILLILMGGIVKLAGRSKKEATAE